MSNETKDGIEDVRNKACDILLDHRLTQKAKDPKKAEAIMNRLHIAEPKKRDNVDRPALVPETVLLGVKKQGPTIIELQEEFGGAGAFHIPIEEHYQLEKEEWRYDKYPEFFNGKNVMDFYDPDITKKLEALEAEEAELLEVEGLTEELLRDEVFDGVATSELKEALDGVRNKKAIKKIEHKLKAKNRKHARQHDINDVIEHFEGKGVDINKESLRSHSKVRKTIKEIEAGQDRFANKALGYGTDESDVVDDEEMADAEAQERGRKRRKINDEEDMDVDEENGVPVSSKSAGKNGRSMTPAQRHISAGKKIRSLTASRREGSTPARLAIKPVTEAQVVL